MCACRAILLITSAAAYADMQGLRAPPEAPSRCLVSEQNCVKGLQIFQVSPIRCDFSLMIAYNHQIARKTNLSTLEELTVGFEAKALFLPFSNMYSKPMTNICNP